MCALPTPPETMAGRTVLQYHILESVGEAPTHGGDPAWSRRYWARLQHPGIAQIYEAGAADIGFGSPPYFAMEFIHGVPL